MKEYKIKARKDHKCDACDDLINKGDVYRLERHRSPKYDDIDNQIGIDYWQIKMHLDETKCYWPEECRKGNHKMEAHRDEDPESDTCGQTFHFCTECSTYKEDIEEHEREINQCKNK